MAKFSGLVGLELQVDKGNGIVKAEVEEHKVRGDLLNEVWRRNQPGVINDKINVTNRISLIAGQYINDNKESIVYVVMDGKPWKVSSIEVQRPRLILNLGGVYNGARPKG